jgi:hypothetical protein
MNAFASSLALSSWSDRSTPQKFSSSSKDSTPACSSFGPSCRIHAIRNRFFRPALQRYDHSWMQLRSEATKTCPGTRDVNRMCQVVDFVERNLHRQHHFLRGEVRLFSIDRLLSGVN